MSIKHILAIAMGFIAAHSAFAVTGGPVFCVGKQTTAMTVEATKISMDFGQSDRTVSNRLMLTARWGLLDGLDLSGSLGTADLAFNRLVGGYSDYRAPWSFAWGAGLRAGWPQEPKTYQILGIVNYVGYQPAGSTTSGVLEKNSSYLFNEISPVLIGGMKFGAMTPYVGVTKPFLFGRKDLTVKFRGADYPALGGRTNYSDSEQALRGILGLEWKLPEGYSIGAEGASTTDGAWYVGVSLAQVLK
jgi:hypothetical protein